MKVSTFIKSAALLMLLAPATHVMAQDVAEGCDLRIWQVLSPKASPLTEQDVKFTVWNNGAPVSHFRAGVKINGETVCEKEFNETVETESTLTLDLNYNVTCPYNETTSMQLYVKADGDTDPTNDTYDLNVTMPRLLDYPYTWNDQTSKDDFSYESFWGMGWGYDDQTYNAFYMSGKSTNWMGELTTLPINFPVDGNVTCAFEFGTSGEAVSLDVKLDYGDSQEELPTVELGQSTQGFSPAFFSFKPKKPATVSISAKLGGAWNQYGSIYLRNICFKDAVKDLAASKIISPSLSQMAISEKPLPVEVAFRNVSPFDIENPVFSYEANGNIVNETYEGIIKGGETLDYTFKQGLDISKTGKVDIKVSCKADGDENAENDEIAASMKLYEPVAFPYSTTFDDGNDLWSEVDSNGDGISWITTSLTDGNNVAAFANYQAACDDQFISPAIAMPKGKARVSFYYTGQYKQGTVKMRLLMNDTPTAEGATELFSKDITNSGWLNGYHSLDITEAGNKYFIFDIKGSGDVIIIDNFKVDAAEDLCIDKTTFNTKSGYGKKSAKVTISYVNHGVTPQGNIGVRYYINDLNTYVDETVEDAVNPGDTIYYTFKKEADISETNKTYLVVGQITTVVGDDTQNDMAYGDAVSNWAVEEVPYYYAFTDDERNARWTIANGNDENSSWNIEDFWFAYDGDKDLKHVNYYGDKSDDWAYSECMHLPAGKYDVSMFYRGRTYFSGEEYNQSFEVKMGKDTTPEAMNIEVGKSENEDIFQPAYRKIGNVVEITEEGNYYIGIHSTSIANQGETHIDAISVVPVVDGLTLPFSSDFENDSTAWTWYNATARQFTKWTVKDGKAVVSRTVDEDSYNYFDGLVVSPKLALEPGKKVKVTMEYSVDSEDENLSLQLYGGKVNNPAEMKALALLPAKEHTFSYEFVPAEDEKEYYLGFRSNTDPDDQENYYTGPFYNIEVAAVNVEYMQTDGIQDQYATGLMFRADNGTLAIDADKKIVEATLYDAAGRTIAKTTDCGNAAKLVYGKYQGVAVLQVKTDGGVTTRNISL